MTQPPPPRPHVATRILFGVSRFTWRLAVRIALLIAALLFAVTGGFAGFDLFFTMTNGQPFGATEVPATWIIKQAFDQNQIGYGVALTVVLTLVVSLISIAYLKISERGNVTRY